ncbi:MAG: iron-sulfur cluster assembly protein [Candidatus Midichloriaceae bacterium]|jgi:iron-sulfur cluster assembly protein
MSKANIIAVTDEAASYIKEIIQNADNNCIGMKIKIESGGCSGHKYKFEYSDKKEENDEEVISKGVAIFIDKSAVLKVFGTTLDYQDTKLHSGFIFKNPNEKGKCGCGESVFL